MALFPSPLERTVASALLLLSSTPPSPSPLKLNSRRKTPKDIKNSEESLSVASIGSKYSSWYLTNDVSSKEVRSHKLSFIAVAAGCHELMKLKVVKKSRSKLCWRFDNQKVTILKPEANPSGSMSTEASCSSSSSSATSSARNKHSARAEKKPASNLRKLRKKRSGSSHMHRRA